MKSNGAAGRSCNQGPKGCCKTLDPIPNPRQMHIAGNPRPPQFVAATATIRSPEEHMRKLTGQEFAGVAESRNGSPRHPRTLLHLPLRGQGTAEEQLARLVVSIIEADEGSQVIAFHDSRQGIERVAKLIDRADVMPYRSGYRPEDSRGTVTLCAVRHKERVVCLTSPKLPPPIPFFESQDSQDSQGASPETRPWWFGSQDSPLG